jgi:hypothetical protein
MNGLSNTHTEKKAFLTISSAIIIFLVAAKDM